MDHAQNPTPIEADGFIYFDDGLALYLSAENGSGANSIAGEDRNQWVELEHMSIAGPPGAAGSAISRESPISLRIGARSSRPYVSVPVSAASPRQPQLGLQAV